MFILLFASLVKPAEDLHMCVYIKAMTQVGTLCSPMSVASFQSGEARGFYTVFCAAHLTCFDKSV